MSVARRVAEEQGCRVGDAVGYAVRFEQRISSETRITYLTGLPCTCLPCFMAVPMLTARLADNLLEKLAWIRLTQSQAQWNFFLWFNSCI